MLDKAKARFEQMKKMKNMRSQMKSVEKVLVTLTFEGYSKNRLVTCVMDGKMNIRSLDISQELVDKKDKKVLEKSIQEAVSDALTSSQKGAAAKMQEMGGIPGL